MAYKKQRNLDGVYFRVNRDGERLNVCYSDMTQRERDEIARRRAEHATPEERVQWWRSMADILADRLYYMTRSECDDTARKYVETTNLRQEQWWRSRADLLAEQLYDLGEQLGMECLRAKLDELGVEHYDNDFNISVGVRYTRWDNGGKREVRYEEWRNGTTRLDAGNVTPEQAIAATVGDKPKDNPRNYNPDGTPKIPNMHIGADPDWVDWVARLKHEEPLNLKEAVEQLMFETICFGGDMGPNDCGGEHCPDEGMVYTNDFINGWVNKIAATVGGTCRLVDNECGPNLHCTACGREVDDEYLYFMESYGYSRCPHCGRQIEVDE